LVVSAERKTYGYSVHRSVDAERRSGSNYKSDNEEGKGRVHGVGYLIEVWTVHCSNVMAVVEAQKRKAQEAACKLATCFTGITSCGVKKVRKTSEQKRCLSAKTSNNPVL